MAGKNGNPNKRPSKSRKPDLSKLANPAGPTLTVTTPSDVQRYLEQHDGVWSPGQNLNGANLAEQEQAQAQALLQAIQDVMPGGTGYATRQEKYSEKLAQMGINDPDAFFSRLDEMWAAPEARSVLEHSVIRYRDVRFLGDVQDRVSSQSIDTSHGPVSMRDAFLDAFDVPSTYGYRSVEDTRDLLLQASGQRTEYQSGDAFSYLQLVSPVYTNLNSLSGPLSRGNAVDSLATDAHRSIYVEAAITDYLNRLHCDNTDPHVRAALGSHRNWPGHSFGRKNALCGQSAIDIASEMSDIVAGSQDAFVEKYGDKFKTPESAGAYYDALNRRLDNAQDLALSYMDHVHVKSPDAPRDPDVFDGVDFYAMTAEVFDIPQAYGYKSHSDVKDFQRALLQLQENEKGRGGKKGSKDKGVSLSEWPVSMNSLQAFDFSSLNDYPNQDAVRQLRTLRSYIGMEGMHFLDNFGIAADMPLKHDDYEVEMFGSLLDQYYARVGVGDPDYPGAARASEPASGYDEIIDEPLEEIRSSENEASELDDIDDEAGRIFDESVDPDESFVNRMKHAFRNGRIYGEDEGPNSPPPSSRVAAERAAEQAERSDPEAAFYRAAHKVPKPVRKVLGSGVIKAEQFAESRAKAKERKLAPKGTNLAGSKTESEYVDELMGGIAKAQYDFITFSEDMARWANPSKTQQMIDARNKAYHTNMMELCVSPLQHGVSAGNVADSIGIYAGMILTSPSFRKYGRAQVANALFPAIEKMTKVTDKVQDCICKPLQRMVNWTERTCGMKVPFVPDKIRLYESKSVTTAQRLREKKESILKDLNNGRVPLTPETAALTYISFSKSAYEMMQAVEPRMELLKGKLGKNGESITFAERKADCDEQIASIQKHYAESLKTLRGLCEMDGLDEEQVRMNIRTLTGTLTTQHPELREIFQETAGFTVQKAKGESVKLKDGRTASVWRGEYTTQRGGRTVDYTGGFTLRTPQSAFEMKDQIRDYLASCMKGIDDPKVIAAYGSSEFAMAAREHFQALIRADSSNLSVQGTYNKMRYDEAARQVDADFEIESGGSNVKLPEKERNARIKKALKDLSPEDVVFERGAFEACELWAREHPKAALQFQMPDNYEAIMRDQARRAEHSVLSEDEIEVRTAELDEKMSWPAPPDIDPEIELAEFNARSGGEPDVEPPEPPVSPVSGPRSDGDYQPISLNDAESFLDEPGDIPDDPSLEEMGYGEPVYPDERDYERPPRPGDEDAPPPPEPSGPPSSRGRDCGPEFRDIPTDDGFYFDGGPNY